MWQLIVLSVALAQHHGPEFKAGWERTKARAELYERYLHGQIDSKQLTLGLARHMTPHEEAWFWQHAKEVAEKAEKDIRRREAFQKRTDEEIARLRAKWMVGPPPPPPDLK